MERREEGWREGGELKRGRREGGWGIKGGRREWRREKIARREEG